MKPSEFLRRTNKRERAEVAALCRTSVPYLYQLASSHRYASPALAKRVEAHTGAAATRSPERLAPVPGRTLVRDPASYEGPPVGQEEEGELVLRTIGISRIRPYENRPRRRANPAYQRIKASIRRSGLRQLLAVVQRPEETTTTFFGPAAAPACAPSMNCSPKPARRAMQRRPAFSGPGGAKPTSCSPILRRKASAAPCP